LAAWRRFEDAMKDLLFVVITVVFFLLSAAYIRGCEKV
jgi:hypothetical protein